MVPTKHLAVFLAVLVFGAGMAYVAERLTGSVRHPEDAAIAADNPTLDTLTKRFDELAEEKGAEYAFDVLRHAKTPPNMDLHLIAHSLGHVLYRQQGIDGMPVCTQEFGNGCSHAIVIEALQEHGDSNETRALIDAACHKAGDALSAYTMCYHGLGHGVFAYYGYSLPETVSFCMKTGTKAYDNIQAYECVGGAVMELIFGGGHDHEVWQAANKKYFTQDPLAPCDTDLIPAAAKPKCYVYMSPHLMERAGANMEVFTDEQLKLGMSYCEVLPWGEERSNCIGGFGKDFVGLVVKHDLRKRDRGEITDMQLQDTERLCNHAPTGDDANTCHAFAISMFFWGGFAAPELAPRYCTSLDNEPARNFCFDFLAGSIGHLISDPDERAVRCEAVPERSKHFCDLAK